jgi:hypothetical protein
VSTAATSFGRGAALARLDPFADRVLADVDFVERFFVLAVVCFAAVLLVPVAVLAADPWAPIGSAGVARHRSPRRRATVGSRRIKEWYPAEAIVATGSGRRGHQE